MRQEVQKIKVDTTLKRFARIIKAEFKPAKIILFGSRSAGKEWQYSDYDFIIVSNTFENIHWLKRISSVVKHLISDRPIDVLPYTVKEFEQKKKLSSIVQDAVRTGVEV